MGEVAAQPVPLQQWYALAPPHILRTVLRNERVIQLLERGSSRLGTGEANSTNSNPHKPLGLSNKPYIFQSTCTPDFFTNRA
ncbi:MAG: hypothetical protein RLZZ169_983 [Pseudomonadota bacterium]